MFGSSPAPINEEAVDGDMRPTSAASEVSEADGRPASPRKSPTEELPPGDQRKRRSSSAAKARELFSNAKQALHSYSDKNPNSAAGQENVRNEQRLNAASSIQKLSRNDPALGVPQGPHNNSAGESLPTPRSTFRVGVTEDKNKKCRRTMEDTHAYLYHFLSTPAAPASDHSIEKNVSPTKTAQSLKKEIVETDNGYFAIFDGHAGTFAADWCGKKLHHILEETIRKNPNTPIPELLDQTFTSVDQQLEKLPLKNSGCTAVIAVLRWEDRVPNPSSATGSTYLNQAQVKAESEAQSNNAIEAQAPTQTNTTNTAGSSNADGSKLKESATRQRVLYTANVGDARIVLCRNGRALRLSYDHKGSDENEGRRVANAGGLILNNRVNGVLAVTRALGDAYMKDLVTGHPYTTETVIQPDQDQFIILACDGLWDVCSDQEAVDLIRNIEDPQAASKALVDHALARFSTDNLSCMIVRFDNDALRRQKEEAIIGVAGDAKTDLSGPSEAQVIVKGAEASLHPDNPPLTGTQVAESHAEGGNVPQQLAAIKESQKEPESGPELNPEALVKARQKKEQHMNQVSAQQDDSPAQSGS